LLMAGDLRTPSSSPGLRDPAEGSSRVLPRLGGVQAQSEAACRQRLRPQGRRQIQPRRAAGMWPMRPADVCRGVYTGRSNQSVYRCDRGNTAIGASRCMMFSGLRVDALFARELMRAGRTHGDRGGAVGGTKEDGAPGGTPPPS
jgi:hypothetical protein